LAKSSQPVAVGRPEPLVSVVIATHNRPAVLQQTLRSVVGQTLQDWETIVIGDACRADTAAVVASFSDPRMSYIDLPVNYGEQSGPNNIGFARARGRFVAILNHDDLWFPDHLAATTGWADATSADVVIARSLVVHPDHEAGGKNELFGYGKGGFYDPVLTKGFGSAQVVRREAIGWLGPWRPAVECYCESSQDWLFRAWRKGARIATLPHVTVLALHSGSREGSYVTDKALEQEKLVRAMDAPDALRAELLASVVDPRPPRPFNYFKRRFLAAAFGVHPRAREFRRKYAPGSYIDALRKVRGLSPMPGREPGVKELLDRYSRGREPPKAG
jgi:glycosyltransferase involved in cell wall biosynthesis